MPPRKTPVITCDYTPLRFFVCNLCAPDRSTEQTKSGHSEPVPGGSVEWDDHGCVICSVCKLGAVAPSVTTARTGICGHCREQNDTFEIYERKLALNPSSGRSGPFLASLFLERAAEAEHDGPILSWKDAGAAVPRSLGGVMTELTVLSNFTPLGKLFALAAMQDIGGRDGLRCSPPSHSVVVLHSRFDVEEPGAGLTASVCYQHGDGFDIGVPSRDVARRAPAGDPAAIADHNNKGLRLEPGTALIVYGGSAVGIAGWVKGRPILLMAPEGEALIQPEREGARQGPPGLLAAIADRWNERVR
jgi:hypothetical protein